MRSLLSKVRLYLFGKVLQNYSEISKYQWLSKPEIVVLQQNRINKILRHAYEHVPYYRELFSDLRIVNSDGSIDTSRFSHIPLLDKEILRNRFDDLKSDDLSSRKWHRNSSGGSTGEPVVFIQDKPFSNVVYANKMLFDSWTGYAPSLRKIRLWGAVHDLFEGHESVSTRLIKWLNNEVWLNAFRMTPDVMTSYAEQMNHFKPVQILAYSEGIYELARFIEREGISVLPPRSIMTSAGTLFPHMRETIERVFNAPVFNRYGSREMGDVACECECKKGLHVSVPTHFVEILRDDGSQAESGELGEIVVTSLSNFAMPLIRYRIGDMGIWSDSLCDCGRNWPLLNEVTGRVTDVFFRRDGGIVSPEYFIHLIGVVVDSSWIYKYQVIQEDFDFITILIVPLDKSEDSFFVHFKELKDIKEKTCLVMGDNCHIEIKFVDEIAPSSSGKYRYTLSKISSRD